ncbi:MAG: protein kinase [Planctomycetia bacterium]|nr:protein kinase [Planctomycetia bacterium]
MGSDTTLLFLILAYREGLLKRNRLMEAVSIWMQDPSRDIPQLLELAGTLKPADSESISRLTREWEQARGAGQGGRAPLPLSVRETIVAMREEPARDPGEAPAAAEERYRAGAELGRGGIGRVIEAQDLLLGRPVALKLLYGGSAQEIAERFRWEARVTGRLEHPNIVPVHDVGVLPSTGEQFMAMKRIVGRDMGRIIADGSLPLRRLVEALRDACRAVSYAHSRGVIHRDLKPANVMLGDFGEVLVVDWGLARLVGEEDHASQLRKSAVRVPGRVLRPIASREETSQFTLDGDVLGTPSYMPPEQAAGLLQKLDERSDVYSLGATLYEILAGRPPFDGESTREILDAVVAGRLDPPSRHRACPPELEAVCMKAMAGRPEDRYGGAADLARDLDAWLEGALERDRRERMAGEALKRAEEAASRWHAAEAQAEKLRGEEREEDLSPAPLTAERAMKMFGIEDAITAARREGSLALADANAALDTALSLVPGHPSARRLKAGVYWELFRKAEESGDAASREIARRMAEVYNDGSLDARLRGDGTIEIQARAWACPCLVEGRTVEPGRLGEDHWHLWSGAREDGEETDGAPSLALDRAVRLRVHAPSCRREPLEGAEAWAFRYEERERILIPVTPEGPSQGPAVPDALLDDVFGSSPYRPRGPGLYLGRTPVARRPWPMGSWLVLLSAPGRIPQRLPFEVRRLEQVHLQPTLYRPGEVPPGFLVVLGRRFESVREAGTSPILDTMDMEDFFISRFPLTSADWAAWLNGLGPGREAEAQARRPRTNPTSGHLWPWTPEGVVIRTEDAGARLRPEEAAAVAENMRAELGAGAWDANWPVLGISWHDAMTWAREASLSRGWAFMPPTMFQHELAGRGGDRRKFPWGPRAWPGLSNANRSLPGGQSPAPADSFPLDESPWGVRGLGGNVGTWCLNDAGPAYRNWRALRGGSWTRPETVGRLSFHFGTPPSNLRKDIGVRPAALVVSRF